MADEFQIQGTETGRIKHSDPNPQGTTERTPEGDAIRRALGPLPPVHPRERKIDAARHELGRKFAELCQHYELTYAERFLLLGELLTGLSQDCVRAERREAAEE